MKNTTKINEILKQLSAEHLADCKPFAAALMDELQRPPPAEMLEGLPDNASADDCRRMIAAMAKPREAATILESGIQAIARGFMSGDKDAAKLVRDTIDGIPVHKVEQKVDITALTEHNILIQRISQSLLTLRPADPVIEHDPKLLN